MRYFPIQFGLPLLTKELIEQSARKRTYIVRTLYALILYGTTLWYFQHETRFATGFSILGQGRTLYLALANLEFWGIYLFLPAMTCGVLTSEKERDTLGLLLLTKLGPWTIIFEKLFSRLVPMTTFVLLSLPLLAIGYSLGGIESADIAKLMWVLAVTALQVGAFSVLCSAWFRTTAAAFLATYLLGTIAIVVSGLFYQVICHPFFSFVFEYVLSPPAYNWLDKLVVSGRGTVAFLAFGPFILNGMELMDPNSPTMNLREQTFLDCVWMTLPLLGTSVLTLFTARWVLWRRAFVHPKSVLLKVFKSLDRFFHRVNHNRVTRGIVLIKESVALPLYQPIRWRETSKRSLGTTRYLIRFLLLLEIPVLFMILWPVSEDSIRAGYAPAYVTGWCLWAIAALVLAIQSTGLIGTERSHQSLDVLLTTPIESDEIIRQKFAGIWRMIHVLWVPFASLYLFQMWWEAWVQFSFGYFQPHTNQTMFTFLRAVLAVGLYLPTIAWFGFYQGLRCRTQSQAILFTMSTITIICGLPPAVAWFVIPSAPQLGMMQPSLNPLIASLSPAFILSAVPYHESDWLILFFHFVGVAAVCVWFITRSRKEFARRVGRNDGYIDDEVEHLLAALSTEERLARLRRGQILRQTSPDSKWADIVEEMNE